MTDKPSKTGFEKGSSTPEPAQPGASAGSELLRRKPFSREATDDILKFASLHSLPPHRSRAEHRRFLTQLITSGNRVIDLFARSGSGDEVAEERVAVGVVLDKIRNPGKTTPFELLGLKRDTKIEPDKIYSRLLDFAEREVPAGSAGLTVYHHFMHPFGDVVLRVRGFEEYLSTYLLTAVKPLVRAVEMPDWLRFQMLRPEQFDAFYELIVNSFAQNLDVPVPSKEDIHRETLSRPIAPFVLVAKDQLAGFVAIAVDESQRTVGELTALAVDPRFRGHGFGRLLLKNAIQALLLQNVTRLNFLVSAPNADSLKLFAEAGFQVGDRFAGFKKPYPPRL